MRVFDEASMRSDPVRGTISSGGCAKLGWLQWPTVTFECKPLHSFIHSFRQFHSDYRYKIACSTDNDENKRELEDFEAGIKSNVYSLVSLFDAVLNDPDADWTNQEVQIPAKSQSTREESPNQGEKKRPEPTFLYKAPPPVARRAHKKRGREEAVVREEPRAKRTATSKNKNGDHVEGADKPAPQVRAPRRRRPLPPPSDRVLRPRPWRR